MKRSLNASLVLGFVAFFAHVAGGCFVGRSFPIYGGQYGYGYSINAQPNSAYYQGGNYGGVYRQPGYYNNAAPFFQGGAQYAHQQSQYVVTGGAPGVPGQPVVIQPNVSGPVTVSGPNGPTTYMGGIQVVRPPVNQGPYYVAPGQVPGYYKGTRSTPPKETHN